MQLLERATSPTGALPPSTEVIGALDLGSKNFKLVVGYEVGGLLYTKLLDKITVNLGAVVDRSGGVIPPKKLQEVETALKALFETCRRQQVTRLFAIATRAVKRATNKDAVVALARNVGIDLEVADGHREGKVGYLAATLGRPNRLVVELGSTSCQIAWDAGDGIQVTPMQIGYGYVYDQYFRDAATFGYAATAFRSFLDQRIDHLPQSLGAFVALAANTLASFVTGKEKTKLQGIDLSHTAIARKRESLEDLSPADFQRLKRTTQKASKILPSLVFLEYILERSRHEAVRISKAELPVGLIAEYFQQQRNGH